jgi:hypothetical protein
MRLLLTVRLPSEYNNEGGLVMSAVTLARERVGMVSSFPERHLVEV